MAVIVGKEDCFVFDFEEFTGQEAPDELEKKRDYFETCKAVSGEPRTIGKTIPVQIPTTSNTALVVICEGSVLTYNEPGAPDYIAECTIKIVGASLNTLGPKYIILLLSESGSIYYTFPHSSHSELLVDSDMKISSIYYSEVFETLLLHKDTELMECNMIWPSEKQENSSLDEGQNKEATKKKQENLKLDEIKDIQVAIYTEVIISKYRVVLNRPGVAGAVLQTPPLLSN